jgi:hypothetical protein
LRRRCFAQLMQERATVARRPRSSNVGASAIQITYVSLLRELLLPEFRGVHLRADPKSTNFTENFAC